MAKRNELVHWCRVRVFRSLFPFLLCLLLFLLWLSRHSSYFFSNFQPLLTGAIQPLQDIHECNNQENRKRETIGTKITDGQNCRLQTPSYMSLLMVRQLVTPLPMVGTVATITTNQSFISMLIQYIHR